MKKILSTIIILLTTSAVAQTQRVIVLSQFTQSEINTHSPVNPDNLLHQAKSDARGTVNYFAQRNAFTVDLNATAIGANNAASEFNMRVRELFGETTLGPIDITAGRKIFRWGTGYVKNPAAFANPEKRTDDVTDRTRSQVGRDVLMASYYRESSDFQFLYLPDLRTSHGNVSLDENELIFKAYTLVGEHDLSFMINWRQHGNERIGLTWAHTLNDALELHAEWAGQHGSNRRYHINQSIDQPFTIHSNNPYILKTEKKLYNELIVGLNYTTHFGVNIITEYSYEQTGIANKNWQQLMRYSNWLNSLPTTPELMPAIAGNLKWVALSLNHPRHTIFTRLAYVYNDLSFECLNLLNPQDQSSYLLGGITYEWKNRCDFELRASRFLGSAKSTFDSLPSQQELFIGMRCYF